MSARMDDLWWSKFDRIGEDAAAGRITEADAIAKFRAIGIDREHAEGHARVAQGQQP
jgi:hypothetical protein